MLVLAVALLAPILGIWLNAERILLKLRQEPLIAGYAALYLKYAAFQLPGFAFNQVVRQVFSAQGLMHVPSIITIIIAPLNMGLNYLLIWGPKPIQLGFIGAPIATSISMTLMSGLYLGYGIWFASHEAWHPISSKMFTSLPTLFRLGITGVGQYTAEWWSWELVSLTASQFGPTRMAAQSVLVASSSSAYMAPGALAVACAVRIGHFLGAGDAHGAKLASRVSIVLACIQSMISASIFLSLRHRLAYFFNNDPAVAKLVSGIVPVLAAYQIVDGVAAITTGILRACGKLSIGAASNFVGYYILGIPLGIYLAFVHHLGLFGLWIGLAFALSFVAVVLYVIILQLDWDVQVREAKERVEAGEENISEGTHA
ncbi:MATE efflux family protein [Ceratobasidium sp. AG-Ba]|nr:MATE efflux family protein [Ceratobasidium sp. AG-Ba]